MVISRNNKKIMNLILYVAVISFIMDILAIITHVYIAPSLGKISLAEILIYFKATISLFIIIIMSFWHRNKYFKLATQVVQMLLVSLLVVTIFYFIFLYGYKFFLLEETISIIRDRILNGNPATAFDFSRQNLRTLKYLFSIYVSSNSEIMLFFQSLLMCLSIVKVKHLVAIDEIENHYDEFLFSKLDFPISIIVMLLSFLSLRVLTLQYEPSELLELIISISGFVFAIPLLISTIKIKSISQSQTCTRTFFKTHFTTMLVSAIAVSIIFTTLFIYHVSSISVNGLNYRTFTTIATVIFSMLLVLRARYALSLENK